MRALVITAFLLAGADAAAPCASPRAVLVSGANKGQGYALCERVLAEQPDAHVFLGARDAARGEAAARALGVRAPGRVEFVPLDVTSDASVASAVEHVASRLAPGMHLHGIVSNAGILWGHALAQQLDVNARGARRFVDAFLPLVRPDGGRVVVVSSGMGPLILGYADADRRAALLHSARLRWAEIDAMAHECAAAHERGGSAELERIGFGGGPFAEAAPDFHHYGLAKMFADAHMASLAHSHPSVCINSCDPGLVWTDLAQSVPRYAGKSREEAGAATPEQGVEAAMRLLFGADGAAGSFAGSGRFYAMSKDRSSLLSSSIDRRPAEPPAPADK
ncbi:hypothetical protein KFE25_010787 [Diacronema lutheri]|uniref:Protochlorophyllide reductase n=2 Tax=Diacronema lutheri TaxID=2081491 RepID=A0A8J6C3G2_DIALT|nr:hypothetical protein KFE25_010787 [Diacronema lutheri]